MATKVNASVQNMTKHLKDLGLSDKENTNGYFLGPKSGGGSKFVIFLPAKNRMDIPYTKKTRKDFLTNELLPTLSNFNGAKYDTVQKNSSAGQVSFMGSQVFIIAKLIASKGAGASKGVAFEFDLEKDFNQHKEGSNRFIYPEFMKEFNDMVLKNGEITNVEVTGKENTPRPLKFDGQGLYCSLRGGARTTKIGSGLADLKLMVKNSSGRMETVNLSAKFGNTVTFFNSGLGKNTFPPAGAFPDEFFKTGMLKEDGPGDRILKLFGIDPQRFKDVFEGYKPKEGLLTSPKKAEKAIEMVTLTGQQKTELQAFIKTIIGEDYWLLHLDNRKHIHMFEMNSTFLSKAAMPTTNLTIEYPVGGSAKRIDIKLETTLYKLNFNIRSKQAGAIYPTHIMCDYSFKH